MYIETDITVLRVPEDIAEVCFQHFIDIVNVLESSRTRRIAGGLVRDCDTVRPGELLYSRSNSLNRRRRRSSLGGRVRRERIAFSDEGEKKRYDPREREDSRKVCELTSVEDSTGKYG